MITIHHGDCIEVMRGMPEESVDSIVTDPPYHLTSGKKGGTGIASLNLNSPAGRSRIGTGFMNQPWDGGDIAFRPETWASVLRVLKPGGYMVAFASTRGYHRMACAIEDGGFIIHPMLGWICGQGFPKAHKVEAEDWEGWHYGLQSLKPAIEPICLAQRPMSERTGTLNVLKHGTGALNIDGCRVACDDKTKFPAGVVSETETVFGGGVGRYANRARAEDASPAGRWPANVCLSYPEDEYLLKPNVTTEQKRELYRWLHENA